MTPGGMGQRELVFVTFLEPIGISASDACDGDRAPREYVIGLPPFSGFP